MPAPSRRLFPGFNTMSVLARTSIRSWARLRTVFLAFGDRENDSISGIIRPHVANHFFYATAHARSHFQSYSSSILCRNGAPGLSRNADSHSLFKACELIVFVVVDEFIDHAYSFPLVHRHPRMLPSNIVL